MSSGFKLKQFRKRKGYSIKEAAEQVGITASTLEKYELKGKPVPVSVLIKLAELYNFDVMDIFGVRDGIIFEKDVSDADIIRAHFEYVVRREAESDKRFGKNLPQSYYNSKLESFMENYLSSPVLLKIRGDFV